VIALTQTAFIFDLDGTLIDSVYDHITAWNRALRETNINVSAWRVHRRIGMSGGLFTQALVREYGHEIDAATTQRLRDLHSQYYNENSQNVRALPGAAELLQYLTTQGVPWAIATSSHMRTAGPVLAKIGVDPAKHVVITRDLVKYAKPDPDLFIAAANQLGAKIEDSVVVGDATWDMLASKRAKALGIGFLSGGYGETELREAGAYRIFEDPADMLAHIDEVGGRR
jgi:HAD superfamily hydrolase (TIGR01549 family)